MAISTVSLTLALLLQAPANGTADWKTYTSDQGGFSVQMPGPPESQLTTQQTPQGPLVTPMLILNVKGVLYLAMRVPNPLAVPKDQQKEFFDGVRQSATAGKTLVSDNRLTVKGVPAADFVLEIPAPNGEGRLQRARFLLWDEKTSFSLVVMAPKGQDTTKEAERFFASFKTVKVDAPTPSPAATPVEASQPRWRVITSTSYGFSIKMPDKPDQNRSTKKTPNGELDIRTYKVDLGTRVYSVTGFNFPEKLPSFENDPTREKALVNLCNGTVEGLNGKMLESSTIKLGSMPGREFRFSYPGPTPGSELIGNSRAYFNGHKAYTILACGEPAQIDTPDTKMFLKSFKLTDEDKSPATTKPERPKAGRPKGKSN